MQGRQCHLSSMQSSVQNITLITMVKNRATVNGFVLFRSFGTYPQFEVFEEISNLKLSVPSFPQIWGDVQSSGKAVGYELQNCNSHAQTPDLALAHFFSSLLETAEAKPADNARVISFGFRLVGLISRCRWRKLRIIFSEMKPPERPELSSLSAGGSFSSKGQRFKDHPFGSIPRCDSSLRSILLIHVASDESPSLRISSSSWARNSSFKRIGNCGERFSGIDMVYAISNIGRVYTSVYAMSAKKQRPGVVATLPRRLTKPLTGVTAMAINQHTQTRPKYQYRFLALCRADMHAKPCRLSVEAETEQDARRILAPHFILSLAARLPLVEVSHA